MATLGIDFGTTNSTVAVSTATGRVSTTRIQAMADYIPSTIAFERATGEVSIGTAARQHLTEPEAYEGYSRFKLLLGETDPRRLEARGYASRSPAEVTRRFLESLLQEWRAATTEEVVDALVLTVPNTWMGQRSHRAREELMSIGTEVGCANTNLLSEPVAASVYFSAWHLDKYGKPFEGHVLVVDVGGGTSDVNLSSLQGGRVEVLDNAGADQGESGLGCAGLAFDDGVVREALRRLGREVDPSEYELLLQLFEERKIHQRVPLLRALRGDPGAVALQFGRPPVPVTVDVLRDVFAAQIRPGLAFAIGRIRERLASHGVEERNAERFRVLLVGGFSQFPLVEDAVRELLDLSSDDVRVTSMPREEGALAIAKGAALVAARAALVIPRAPLSVGFWNVHHVYAYSMDHATHRRDGRYLIERGSPIEDRLGPVWFPEGVALGSGDACLELVLDDGHGRAQLRIDRPLRELLPDSDQADALWEIGLSVDSSLIYRFHARRQGTSREIETPLGELGLSGFHSQ